MKKIGVMSHESPMLELSGGHQQRVAFVRCMAMWPGIILFDEPLSNLDAFKSSGFGSRTSRASGRGFFDESV